MSYQTISLELNDSVARITLNRPDKLNSFTGQMHVELRDALDGLQNRGQARVLVLTGAGRGFCAGQDLADPELAGSTPNEMADLGKLVEKNYKPLVMRLQDLNMPTIAAVNGIAAGAGASLALACDLTIAKASASFMLAFSKIGLIPDTGSTWFYPRRIGMARALGAAMLAQKLPATKAAEWGLIWEAVEDEAFDAHIDKLARELAIMPTKALVRTRQAMQTGMTQTLESQLGLEGKWMSELGASHDYAEGVQAFIEKRAPQFKGK
ncbi:MAG: 2-(1,2-epoxy-1,2-dihydrophenyl)acetyl-CoA isomerase PaaG [Burkholderiaceae bacterium]|nr:2-(1,2-epoxy-1,2-dihydrophenyl)acetyl-CoA isomerase PaaG [Burkholderiaceae bacterium]MCD8536373.1 2-(1,2-epoxy-1,2-dihydrophenyl)acetyl-CoA isomerase PaaG [Burkholderiaceae bacterium]MCD8565209.1 2-(1,2-epoxy-1,2-dihydrophenyl)acetyl-CoA isomerase PaaG [Burkholderiaceae bacterium]